MYEHKCKWTLTFGVVAVLLLSEVGWIYMVEQRANANEKESAILKTKLDIMVEDVSRIRILLEKQLKDK